MGALAEEIPPGPRSWRFSVREPRVRTRPWWARPPIVFHCKRSWQGAPAESPVRLNVHTTYQIEKNPGGAAWGHGTFGRMDYSL